MDDIRITPRILFLIFIFFVFYLYLNDKISNPTFKEYVNKVTEPLIGNSTSHTFLNLLNENVNLISATISSSSVYLLYNLPVIFDT